MAEHPDSVDPVDPFDERIRALLGRALADAPAPPEAGEIADTTGDEGPTLVLVGDGSLPRSAALSPARRTVLAVAASVAVVLMVVAGALAVGRLGGPTGPARGATLPGELAVRYVLGDAEGRQLAAITPSDAVAQTPLPRVSVYAGDGVTVRIAAGPPGWAVGPGDAAGGGGVGGQPPTTMALPPDGPGITTPGDTTTSTIGPGETTTVPVDGGTDATGATGPPGTAGMPDETTSSTSSPTSTTAPATSTTTTPTTTTTTTAPPTATTGIDGGPETTGSPTTTVASMNTPPLAGLPVRSGIRSVTVRGTTGGLEVHDDDTSTVWFAQDDQLVAVDVFGLDAGDAVALVDRLDADDAGGLVPAGDDEADLDLAEVATAPAEDPLGTGQPPAESAQVVYASAAGPTVTVTTVAVLPDRQQLLVAAAAAFGRVERWGDHDGLVDRGGSTATFLDPSGALVIVQAAPDDLRSSVEDLVALDRPAWDQLVADNPVVTVPPVAPTTVPPTTQAGP
jgi:hypothetical protein